MSTCSRVTTHLVTLPTDTGGSDSPVSGVCSLRHCLGIYAPEYHLRHTFPMPPRLSRTSFQKSFVNSCLGFSCFLSPNCTSFWFVPPFGCFLPGVTASCNYMLAHRFVSTPIIWVRHTSILTAIPKSAKGRGDKTRSVAEAMPVHPIETW